MISSEPGHGLAEGMRQSRMTFEDLWYGVVAMGSDLTALEVEAYVLGVLVPSPHVHNVIAQALNEHTLAQGGDHPVPYHDL
jgi:hypothetical protein